MASRDLAHVGQRYCQAAVKDRRYPAGQDWMPGLIIVMDDAMACADGGVRTVFLSSSHPMECVGCSLADVMSQAGRTGRYLPVPDSQMR
jgi:hypothetical protein